MRNTKPLNRLNHVGGSIPVFRGARMQRGYGLGGMLKGLFKSAVPLLKQGGKVIGKNALQSGLNIAQNVMKGDNLKRASNAEFKKMTKHINSFSPLKKNGRKRHKTSSKAKATITSSKAKRRRRSPDIFDTL